MSKFKMNFENKFEFGKQILRILLCFALFNLISQHSKAIDLPTLGPPNPLEIEVGTEEKISLNASFKMQASSLKHFYIQKVWAAFPVDLQTLLAPYRMTLFLTSYCPSDGLFLDPTIMGDLEQTGGKGAATLWMCMKPDLFWGLDAYTLLAHEVFHAVHFLVHPNEVPWVREGLAQWFEYRVTGNFNGSNIKAAFEHPETSLFGAYFPGKTHRNQYGHNLLYIYYLWSHCGGDSLVWDITRASYETDRFFVRGLYSQTNIDVLLKTRKTKLEVQPVECESFETSAVSFEIARIHNKMNYDGSTNKPYHLLATALQPVEPHKEIPIDIDGTELSLLGAYTPILISGEAAPKSVSSEKFHTFWLEKFFPYSVKSSRPDDYVPARWNVLLIKK